MILVTGATGKFGGSTARFLQQRNIRFRVAANHLEKLKSRFGSNTELSAFDWEQPKTFSKLLKGISTVSLMPPPVVTKDFHIKAEPFLQAAKEAGVSHLVLTTALYSDYPDSMFYQTENLIKKSGIDFTIIRPSFVFQNFLNQFLQSVQNGVILAPSEKGRTSYVDVRDVGEATAVVLENPGIHKGNTYSITGSEALTHDQIAAIFSEQLSKPVVHISPSIDDYKKTLSELNVPVFLHQFLADLYSTIAKGQWEKVSNDYARLTGKDPITFTDFVKEHRSIFLENEKAK